LITKKRFGFYFSIIKQLFMNQLVKKGERKKLLFFSVILMIAMIPGIVDAGTLLDINSGLMQATTTINGTYALVSRLCLAIGAIVGLAGGIRIYVKWNNGDHEIQKDIIGWGGACVFLLLTGTVLNVFFT
jgi:hypothetical protein